MSNSFKNTMKITQIIDIYMRTKLTTHFLLLFLLVGSTSFANLKITNDQDPEKDKVLISVLNYMLTKGHYNQKE